MLEKKTHDESIHVSISCAECLEVCFISEHRVHKPSSFLWEGYGSFCTLQCLKHISCTRMCAAFFTYIQSTNVMSRAAREENVVTTQKWIRLMRLFGGTECYTYRAYLNQNRTRLISCTLVLETRISWSRTRWPCQTSICIIWCVDSAREQNNTRVRHSCIWCYFLFQNNM